MQDLLALVEKHLGKSWVDVVGQLRDVNGLDDIAERLHQGDEAGAIQGVEDAARDFADATHTAYVDSGEAAAEWLSDKADAVVRFDVENKHAAAWAKQNEADLVREVTQEQRDLVHRVVADGVAAGRNPREVARDLRDSIGLTDYQARIVANYRAALEAGDWSNALGRDLTDGRDDRTIQRLMDSDKDLKAKQIDQMVERYRANWVAFRAETIARTEGLRCLHEGTEQLFRQAIDNGDVDGDKLTRQWNHASRGKNSRDDHEAMNGQEQSVGDPFELPGGDTIRFPGDPDADPSQTINCRCCLSTRLAV